MQKKKLRLLRRGMACFCAAALLATLHTLPEETAYAKTLSELQEEQDDIERRKEEAEAALSQAQTNQERVSAEIETLDLQMAEAQNALNIVENQLNDAETRLAASEENLAQAEQASEDQFNAFSDRIRFIYENGMLGYLEVLLESQSFSDFFIRLQYVNDIMEYDNEVLTGLREAEATIERETQAIAEEKASIEVLVADQQTKNAALQSRLDEKNALMAQYQQDEADYAALVESMEEASEEVTRLIEEAQAASRRSSGGGNTTVYYTGGQFEWPVPGWYGISSGFVSRNRPIGSGTEFHTGYDILASYGTNVIAAEAGTVIYASWMNGYGYTVMIDHGGGLVTLYGHNSSLVASVGQTVSRGSVIAHVGSTGNSTGNHCHFEVRLNGSPVSPSTYLGV